MQDVKTKLTQPQIIQDIINQVCLPLNATKRQTPELATKILRRDASDPKFNCRFHYHGGIRRLKFLEKITHPEMLYPTHQCARLPKDPRAPHGAEAKKFVKYLPVTKKYGLIWDPKKNQNLEVYADSDFSGNCHNTTAPEYFSTEKLHTSYTMFCTGCPIIWDFTI